MKRSYTEFLQDILDAITEIGLFVNGVSYMELEDPILTLRFKPLIANQLNVFCFNDFSRSYVLAICHFVILVTLHKVFI
ncbi:hypothetical protein B7O87_05120 [Cylindrospermopsis raciborskii CENA303]|uniref:Uncharacterized protein n=2 Tax=Cylindrospermopsis raciborskii TaxID=77022 RepID=A0A1X4G326_9CYAN|nr:hypothetical protein B7O87_14800 [Cylindrospermopsis raciborskii CENA303]OSO93888.1 hypothetical protein B7O87_05120 [Cylindrospermopsis raciborskii CENA303]